MKIIIVCLMSILTCSCRQVIDNSHSMKRRDEIRNIMKDHYHKSGRAFEIRGPLTVAQFEEELIELHKESSKRREKVYGFTERFEDSGTGEVWGRLKGKYREGDELYFFTSDERSWNNLCGIEGYVLIRKNKIIDLTVTAMN